MEAIITAVSGVFSLVGTTVTEIQKIPVLLFFLAASLVPVGLALFKKMKKSVG